MPEARGHRDTRRHGRDPSAIGAPLSDPAVRITLALTTASFGWVALERVPKLSRSRAPTGSRDLRVEELRGVIGTL